MEKFYEISEEDATELFDEDCYARDERSIEDVIFRLESYIEKHSTNV